MNATNQRVDADASVEARRLAALLVAEAQQISTEAEVLALREKEHVAEAYARHRALLRLAELETPRALAMSANARIYIGFDKHAAKGPVDGERSEGDAMAWGGLLARGTPAPISRGAAEQGLI